MKLKWGTILITGMFTCFGLISSCSGPKATWQGTIEEINGVAIVKNPKEPMYGENALILEEELAFGGAESTDATILAQPFSLAVDDKENIYVLDIKAGHIKVFNNSGDYLRTIGQRGQGPGELQGPLSIQITPENEIMVNCITSSRMVYLSFSGDYLRETHMTKLPRSLLFRDKNGDYICQYFRSGEIFKVVLEKYNSEQEVMFQITEIEPNKEKTYQPLLTAIIFNINPDNQIIWAINTKYEIMVNNPDGSLSKKIMCDFNPVAITEEFKKNFIKRSITRDPDTSFPKHFPPLQSAFFSLDEDGRIFALTHEKSPDGKGFYFDVFDTQGRFITKVPLKQVKRIPLVWKKGKLYTIEEDDEGYLDVKRYKATWKI